MAAVILGAIRPSVVAEAEVVADLVGSGFRDVGFVVAQIIEVDPRGPVSCVTARRENIDVGHAAGRGIGVRIAIGVGVARYQGMRGSGGEGSRAFGGYVNVEWRVILNRALPDLLDG